jgi:hypothetical protein
MLIEYFINFLSDIFFYIFVSAIMILEYMGYRPIETEDIGISPNLFIWIWLILGFLLVFFFIYKFIKFSLDYFLNLRPNKTNW